MAHNQNGGWLSSFVIGGVTGAALALLFAPKSGRELRQQVGRRIREGAEYGREMAQNLVARGEEMLDDATQTAQSAMSGSPSYGGSTSGTSSYGGSTSGTGEVSQYSTGRRGGSSGSGGTGSSTRRSASSSNDTND